MSDPAYYEAHVTIEPLFGAMLDLARRIARDHGFRVADLVMLRNREATPERSAKDTFLTGRGRDREALEGAMRRVRRDLEAVGIEVWRLKIEAVLLDERFERTR